MYTIDHEDALRTLDDLPRSSIGAPLPLILSDEHTAVVAYYEVQLNSPQGVTTTVGSPVMFDFAVIPRNGFNYDVTVTLAYFQSPYLHVDGPASVKTSAGSAAVQLLVTSQYGLQLNQSYGITMLTDGNGIKKQSIVYVTYTA